MEWDDQRSPGSRFRNQPNGTGITAAFSGPSCTCTSVMVWRILTAERLVVRFSKMTLQPMSASIWPQHVNAAPACAALLGEVPAWMTWNGLGLAVAGIFPGNATSCLTFRMFECAKLHDLRVQFPAVGRKRRCNTFNWDRERQSPSLGFGAGPSVPVVSDPFSQMPLSSTPFSYRIVPRPWRLPAWNAPS